MPVSDSSPTSKPSTACQGYHVTPRQTKYCIRLPDAPLSPGQRDTVIADVRRWDLVGPWKLNCDDENIEDISHESDFAYGDETTTLEAGPLVLTFNAPLRSQPAGRVQRLKFKVHRQLASDNEAQGDCELPKLESLKIALATTSSVESSDDTTTKKSSGIKHPQMLVTPIGCSDSGAGPSAVKLGDTLISLFNKHLKAALMDPDLGAELPAGVESAYQALQRGKPVLVNWHEPSQVTDRGTIHTEWFRIVSRVKPQDLVYFVSEEHASLTSRLSDTDAAKRYKEDFTVVQTAVLYDNEREALERAMVITGWPCKVVDGKIVIELFGKTLRLDQQQITPRPLANGLDVRLLLEPLDDASIAEAKCQPMACSPEASWVINRYEFHFKYKKATHRYEPYSAHIDPEWEQLLQPIAEAMVKEMADHPEGRFVYHHQYACRPKGDLIGGVAIRLRDGGSRLPLQALRAGWATYTLPGTPGMYSWGAAVEGKVVDYIQQTSVEATIRGPELYEQGSYDIILLASGQDVEAGTDFGICPRNKPGRITARCWQRQN